MAPPPLSLDYWRGFFSGARASIFDAIDATIRVAAADHPDGLLARRDAIAERLYTALIVLPPAEASGLPAPGPPLQHQLLPAGARSVPSICSSDRAEAVTDEGSGGTTAAPRSDCDGPIVAEALRVKAALSNAQEKSEAELLELLARLRRLEFTVDAIMATEIGMAVKPLRKHSSKQIRQLVRSLIEGWEATVNEWMSNGGSIVGAAQPGVGAGRSMQQDRYMELMDLHQDLVDKLDFSHGIDFQREILRLFNASVHHPSSSPVSSFFLLVTFRRYTFRLTEDSVALALQSCLGGSAHGFHVKFLSENHFRISVSCKSVGFHIFALRRFVGSCFDIYFHLWNNGVAYREADKRRWELEQEAEWTTVQSKKKRSKEKRLSYQWVKELPKKKVRFADKLVQDSPVKKHQPPAMPIHIYFGAFRSTFVPPISSVPIKLVFGRILSDLDHGSEPVSPPCSSRDFASLPPHCAESLAPLQNSNSNAFCGRCLSLGHWASICNLDIRCRLCRTFGHIARFCPTKPVTSKVSRPIKRWRVKTT
ncbi:uncharacterized protein LOC133906684 [Phragmites australis]|uniref:uncharacterized protein LOC133906684 n=1 Tax=Phragmites australis TaxID=29695 RepID=UPI002D772FCD|nr:uncharacterized protein LOC133906684 [Phragmites australis]